jgi:hypothetical protein
MTEFGMIAMIRGLQGLVCVVAGVAAPAVLGQNPVQWLASPEQGIAIAQRTQRPLLFYVPGDIESEDSDLERAQKRSFRDETVTAFIRARYVPVRLPRSNTDEEMLHKLGVYVRYGLFLVVVTPTGQLVGTIQPGEVAQTRQLVERLAELFRRYRNELFAKKLQPQLAAENLDMRRVREALWRIREFDILKADETVTELLDRPDLDERMRVAVYSTLASLSTQKSVQALLDAAESDKFARQALKSCTPMGAWYMLGALTNDYGRVRLYVYRAVARICGIRDTKSDYWLENARPKYLQKELERVRTAVERVAQNWRRRYGALR